MAEKYFKYLLFGLFGFSALIFINGLMSDDSNNYNVNVTQMVSAADGLNLKAVGELLKNAETPEQFEKALNSPNNGVNNLDLNEDGRVDYISVTQFGDDTTKGFSLTTSPAPGETQEIATIKIEKDGEGAKVEAKGNESIYGRNHYYHSSWSPGFGTGLLMGYLFSGGPSYRSPYYGYGRYPPTYRQRTPMSRGQYRNRMEGMTSGKGYTKSRDSKFGKSAVSPNKNRSASSIKAPLKNPTQSQRSFQSRNPSKQVRKGGFGRKSPGSGFGRKSSGFGSSRSVRGFGRSGGFFRGK